MPEFLHLILFREPFEKIATGEKRIEYRQQTAFWRKRLEGRKYDIVHFRNGYAKDAPEMLVEFIGVRRYGHGRNAHYAIRLGRVLKIKRWKRRKKAMGEK